MSQAGDDLDAVRAIAVLLEPFGGPERERILRWVRERVGMTASGPLVGTTAAPAEPTTPVHSPGTGTSGGVQDIKSFIESKKPRSETQLAATVAYYHQFVARGEEQKDSITANDVLEACRKADWKRPARAAQTMVNAFANGVFDKLAQGKYRLNSVGENLVAMVLPGSVDGNAGSSPTNAARRRTASKSNRKGAAKKKPRK